MSAKDGSESFDVVGTYTFVVPLKEVRYEMEDGRNVSVMFEEREKGTTKITQEFEMEGENSKEVQRAGWQAILDNFKKYAENYPKRDI